MAHHDGEQRIAAGRCLQADELRPAQRDTGSVAHEVVEDTQADRPDVDPAGLVAKDRGDAWLRACGRGRPDGEQEADREIGRAPKGELERGG